MSVKDIFSPRIGVTKMVDAAASEREREREKQEGEEGTAENGGRERESSEIIVIRDSRITSRTARMRNDAHAVIHSRPVSFTVPLFLSTSQPRDSPFLPRSFYR